MTLEVANLPGIVENPSWSIDGNSIFYTHDVSGFESPTGRQFDARIFIKNLIDTTYQDISLTNQPVQTIPVLHFHRTVHTLSLKIQPTMDSTPKISGLRI
jgi:hypothetical protein